MEELNKQQEQAVDIVDGSALVVAGAGTGKTRVIVERVKSLMRAGVKPENILALTFTDKAAGEMRDRLSISAAMDVNVHTFNGLGQELLEQYGPEWGLSDLRLLGEVGELVFVREHLDDFGLDYFAPLSSPTGQLKTLCGYVSKLKQELILPNDYTNYADSLPVSDEADELEKKKQQEIAAFYSKYMELAREHHVITFDDQIFLSIQLLEARPNILRELQDRYQYILVDEFQDTNTMQSRLIDLLASEHHNLMAVGDDDQAIYGWRGATLANILDFKKRYPKATDVPLIKNYRSTQEILDVAYRLIQQNNPNRLEVTNSLGKRLIAHRGKGAKPKVIHFYTQSSELTWIAEDIAAHIRNGADPGQIAVLARSNAMLAKVHQALDLNGVEHIVIGVQEDLYRQPAVGQLIEIMSAINDPQNSTALFHALSGPAFVLPQNELSELASNAKYEHTSLADSIKESGNKKFVEALNQIERWRSRHADVSVRQLAFDIITDSGWKARLAEREGEPEAIVQAQALSAFFKTLQEFEQISLVPSVRSYLDNLETLRSGGEVFDGTLDVSESKVNVMSVHKAKGLEWERVYIADCVDGSFPSSHSGPKGLQIPTSLLKHHSSADERMAEERRAMYVAVTRARSTLILTYGDKVRDGGKHRKPSRFLQEMFGDVTPEIFTQTEQINLELFTPEIGAIPAVPSAILHNGTYTLSASQIATYIHCPRNFYYKYILNLPEPEGAAASYGTALHAAIQLISEGRLRHNVPTYAEVEALIKSKLPKRGFASEGIQQKLHTQALETAKRIYERFTTEQLPTEVEKRFVVRVPELPVILKGRMDAIYTHEKGIEIRDYKSSSAVTTYEQAKAKTINSQQLTVYALAWQLLHDELPAALTLDYVETGQMASVKRTQLSLDSLKKKLSMMVESMETGNYPLGSRHEYCSHPPVE